MEKFLNIRSVEEIPLPYRQVFSEYVHFNPVQSEVLDDVFDSDDSIVISAPTGSGKTAIFELAIVRLLMQYANFETDFKVVYISPIKSLCQERLIDWNKKFSNFGINCICVTGDTDNADFQSLTFHNLIISTPEKWDSLTRKWRDHEKLVRVIKLFMIDEVHLLNEEDRGSTLEVIVSRMKTVQSSLSLSNVIDCRIRFIALSATIGNVDDIAEWIGSPKYFRFAENVRPVQLKKLVLGFSCKQSQSSAFKFDLSLNYRLQSLLIAHSEGKPTLIFCSTRKSVEMTAKHLVQTLNIKLDPFKLQQLQRFAIQISDAKIKEMLSHGIGVHHAGMDVETRHVIEELFRNGDLPILIATSTLAMGVNLPAHLVIIKSTKYYVNGTVQDYTATAIHQMIGRAGRPQFDTSATALILTTNEDKSKIEKMLSSTEPVESNLHRHLTEHLNAEVVLGTITGLDVALQWLTTTFLYIRARINPRHYGLSLTYKKEQLDKKLLEMFQIDLNKLVRAGMITMDENINVSPTITGRLMASYYVDFETMKMFTQITGKEIFIQILSIISKCQEFAEMRLRVSDKKTLNLLNKNAKKQTIRFPLNGKIKTWDMKVNCIIQAVLGNLEIMDTSIQTESFAVMRHAKRVIKCLIHYLSMRKQNCYAALLNATILGKCLNAKLWENSPYVTKQLTGIGSIFATQLANAGKDSFDKILDANPRDIEMIVKRKPPFGDYLIEEVSYLPKFSMNLKRFNQDYQLTICLINFENLLRKSTVSETSTMTLLVGNDLNETLIYEKYEISYLIENPELTKIIKSTPSERVEAHFISEDWVGIDCHCELICNLDEMSDVPQLTKNNVPPKKSSYIQTFLDIYKIIKKPEKSGSAKSKQKNKIEELVTDENAEKLIEEKVKNDMKHNQSLKYLENHYDIVKDTQMKEDFNNDIPQKSEIKRPQLTISDIYDLPEDEDVEAINELSFDKQKENMDKDDVFSNSFASIHFHSKAEDVQADLDEICLKEAKQKELSLISSDLEQDLIDIFTGSQQSSFNDSGKLLTNPNTEENTDAPRIDDVTNSNSEENTDTPRIDDVPNSNSEENTDTPRIDDVPVTTPEERKMSTALEKKYSFDNSLTNNHPFLYALSHKYLTDESNEDKNAVAKPTIGKGGKNLTLKNILNNKCKKRKKSFDIHSSEELEDQSTKLQKEERDRKHYLESFKKPSKKKLSHLYDDNNYHVDSTTGIHPYKMTILDDQKSNFIDCSSDNQKKNISWRSPLIFSPGVKFSPVYSEKLDNEYKVNDHNLSSDSSFGSSKYSKHSFNLQKTPKRPKDQNVIKKTPIKSSQFPLSDKDYNYSQGINKTKEMKMDKYSDIFSPKLRLNGFKKKEKTSTPRLLTKHSPVTACEFYISETNKLRRKENVDPNSPKNVEPNSPKNVQIRNDIEEMEENDSNTSINFCEKESFLNYSDDEIISQNRPIPEEYIEPKIRNKYPVYPEIESPTIDRSVNRPMQRSIHYSNYVNPMQSDYHPNNYGQQYHESPIDTMHNYGYAAPPCEMRYVPPYGPVERPYQYAFDQKMTPRRSFSPEERYETLLIPKPVPLNPQSRCFYRPPAMMQEDSFLMPSSSVNYNQNVSKQGYFPRNEYPVPYGYIPEYQHNQVVGDKDYVMSNYWRSLNSEQQ